jgi:inner membrane protein
MDSLTQAVLGAGVGVAVAGRRLGPRKAALTGAVLGTVPDLDVFWGHGDPVSDFVLHRSATHSLIIHALVTPLFGEALMRLMSGLRDRRWTAYWLVFLCFSTHALLDAMTVYGTQLLWPVTDYPFGTGSMFIIDPLYTLPLLALTIWALFKGTWSAGLGRGVTAALAVSTLYLGWSLIGQAIALDRADAALAKAGITPERTLSSPTPFNTLLWRVIAIDGDRYLNLYVPLLGGEADVVAHAHPRTPGGAVCLDKIPHAATVAAFTKGFYRLSEDEDGLRIGDLRMGLTPSFVFDFRVAERAGDGYSAVPPVRVLGNRQADGDLEWLVAGLTGGPGPRPAEMASFVELDTQQTAAVSSPTRGTC